MALELELKTWALYRRYGWNRDVLSRPGTFRSAFAAEVGDDLRLQGACLPAVPADY